MKMVGDIPIAKGTTLDRLGEMRFITRKDLKL